MGGVLTLRISVGAMIFRDALAPRTHAMGHPNPRFGLAVGPALAILANWRWPGGRATSFKDLSMAWNAKRQPSVGDKGSLCNGTVMRRSSLVPLALSLAFALTACGDRAKLPLAASYGPVPQLPPPVSTVLPTIAIADAEGWPAGLTPVPAPGFSVSAFAAGLDHPRWVYALPNGDVLVAETDAPPQPKADDTIKGFFMKLFMKKAGSGLGSANRITLLRDADGDGVAETRSPFITGLNSPFGMALVGSDLYIANTDAVLRFPYERGQLRITAPAAKLIDLPAGTRNRHWTKSLVASPDGTKLYVGVGSDSNVGEYGMDAETGRAAVWELDRHTGAHRILAYGLRNPVGMAFEPTSGRLWVTVNERDELASDLVPDYMTALVDGGFYGWPYSYFGQNLDARPEPQRPDLTQRAIVPDYALGAHTASLGLTFGSSAALGHGAFVGQRGSWNRRPPSGYGVIFVPFAAGRPSGPPRNVLTGFLGEGGKAYGRPVGVEFDTHGALLLADDVGRTVWRVVGAREAAKCSRALRLNAIRSLS